jgi:NAD(P)-dependent dehydrogenase (short-subunit alcohol dehydrogenase family)
MPLNPPIQTWQGRVAWLVGASSGIGRATASLLHRQGAQVIVSARSADALQAFVAEHPGSVALPLDAADRAALRDASRQIEARFGRLDLAAYCAGIYTPMRAADFDLDEALRHVQINQAGALHLLDAVLPLLLRQRQGHLCLVSSVAGYRGLPQALAYGPTKAALISLAESLWLDLQPLGIGVSLVCPGFVDTPLTARNTHPMPALIGVDEAARCIVRGWQQGRFEMHFPRRFTTWLKLARMLPYGAYFRVIRRVTGL